MVPKTNEVEPPEVQVAVKAPEVRATWVFEGAHLALTQEVVAVVV